jgi:hypothetical protein
MARPNVMLAIVQAARGRLARGVPLALTALEHLVEKAASERVRLEAAKALLDRAGLVAPAPSKGDSNAPDKSLNEMSLDIAALGCYAFHLRGAWPSAACPGKATNRTLRTQ